MLRKEYWEYIEGNLEEAPEIPKENTTATQIRAYKDWNQGTRKVLHWLSFSITDSILGHIQYALLPKEAWGNLVKCLQQIQRQENFSSKLNKIHWKKEKCQSMSML